MKKNTTRRALLMSLLSLLLCVSMLIGTTYAWFTDSVTSANNIIKSGNLDIDLEYWNGSDWKDVSGSSEILDKNALWEPGYTETVYLKLTNAGSLALKYQLGVNIISEKEGVNQATETFKLSDYIYFDVVPDQEPEFASREDAMKNATETQKISAGFSKAGSLEADSDPVYLAMVIYMPTSVGNVANHDGATIPEINLGINVFATQYTSEADSFGPDYDYLAPPVYVATQEELATALKAGVGNKAANIVLTGDIALTGEWAPIGDKDAGEYFNGVIDGAGYKITGLSVSSGDYVALISAAKDATIKNLNVEGAVAGDNAAGIVARVEGATVIENCVSSVNLTASTKAGGIACNVTGTNPQTVTIRNCVNNGTVTGAGEAGLGGIVGYINTNATVDILNCVNNGDVTGGTAQYAGATVGYAAANSAGLIVEFENSGAITGKNSKGDAHGRWLEAKDGTILAAYCGTPANWDVSYEVAPETITDAFVSNGSDIKAKIGKVIFGKPADYPEIVANYTATVSDGVSVYQVPTDSGNYEVYYLSEDKISAPADSSNLFAEMKTAETIDVSNLDMSQVENALCMFLNCTNLKTLDTENWDMSNVTNMQSLFYGCNKLDNIDVSNWDTSSVTNMRMVFFRCYELPNDVLEGVENWDVSNVTNFYSMFKHARGLTDLDLSKWDTSSATNMSHMFANIGGVQKLDLSSFDTSKVTDMSWMFYDASKLTTILVGDGWTTAALDPAKPTCFYNNQALVGGAGTAWLDVCDMANPARPWESSAKITYAIVDGGTSAPGLLTYKAA